MVTISTNQITCAAFVMNVTLVALGLSEYVLDYNVVNHAPQYFRLIGETEGSEEFACLDLALEAKEELLAYAELNAKFANRNWLKANNKNLAKTEEKFKQKLMIELVKSELVVLSKEQDEEQERYLTIYSWRGFTLEELTVGLDMWHTFKFKNVEVYSEGYSFEEGCWPSAEEFLVHSVKCAKYI